VFLLLFHAMSLAPPELADMQREMIPTVRSQPRSPRFSPFTHPPGDFFATTDDEHMMSTLKVRLYVLAIRRLVQRNLALDIVGETVETEHVRN
jgi:hypothetical protein